MRRFAPTLVLTLVSLFSENVSAENWPRFRGENGTGISTQSGIPVSWEAGDYAWTIDLPGVGHSAPVIWEKTLFVTSATEGGGTRYLHCLDADSGQQRWQTSVTLGESKKHLKNSWASSTPATDGQRVYVMFADNSKLTITAWNFEGKEVWTKDLGSYESEHNLGVSPIVQDGLLIVSNDQVGPSSLLALNPETGETVWTAERNPGKTSYSTPVIAPGKAGSLQILCISESNGITSTDLRTGTLNWQTPKLPMRTVASPIVADGLIFATCGEGGNGKYFAAAKIDPDADNATRIVYERKTMLPYVPCLVARDGLLFLWGDKGIMVCLEIATGKEVWSERIDGQFSGSPVCIEDRLYCVTEDGVVVVLHAGHEFRELGRTALGDDCHSTPAVANGHLYLRTFHKVFAVKAKQ
ncbi:MAG: PQQ-binding-like beta-propeller repeat protein [Planctomycetaceae bacterium]